MKARWVGKNVFLLKKTIFKKYHTKNLAQSFWPLNSDRDMFSINHLGMSFLCLPLWHVAHSKSHLSSSLMIVSILNEAPLFISNSLSFVW